MSNESRSSSVGKIMFVTFFEGVAVMAAEILSARMVSPVFGTSITSWSFVLGITLMGLAAGYFFGGWLCKKGFNRIGLILAMAGVWLALLPLFATQLLGATMYMGYYPGLITSLLLILFPTLFFLGTLSPLLVHLIDQKLKITGLSSGRIFSVSTMGGIIGALLFGLFMLPEVGISISFYLLGAVLFLLSFLFPYGRGKTWIATGVLALVFLASNQLLRAENSRKILYSSEGLLGQVKVVQSEFWVKGKPEVLRMQLINNTLQGIINVNDPLKSYLEYQILLKPIFENRVKEGNMLVLGLGAGLIYNLLGDNKNLQIDFVEIDPGIAKSAQRYFIGPQRSKENMNIFIDDARHFTETTTNTYNGILVDTFAGETIPGHVLTLEALTKIRSLLKEDGLLVINFHGNWSGEKGRGARSLYKTIEEAGFNLKVVPTDTMDSIERSLLFLCSFSNIDDLGDVKVPKSAQTFETEEGLLSSYFLDVQTSDLENDVLLTDDKQQLEHLLREVCLDWRRYCIKNYVQPFEKEKSLVFY
ncbi:MAG: spermidine synthase [Owenweeksia sp.]